MAVATTRNQESEPAALRAGWLDRFLVRIDRLPGPAIAWLIGIPAVVAAFLQAVGWIVGERAPGVLEPGYLVPLLVLVYLIVAVYAVRSVAESSFERFRPALDASRAADPSLRGSLVGVPAKIVLPVILLLEILISGSYLTSPAAMATLPTGRLDAVLVFGTWMAAVALFALLVVLSVQQLRGVSRLHRLAVRVDPFRPDPINAFSRLTLTNALVRNRCPCAGDHRRCLPPDRSVLLIGSAVRPVRRAGCAGR